MLVLVREKRRFVGVRACTRFGFLCRRCFYTLVHTRETKENLQKRGVSSMGFLVGMIVWYWYGALPGLLIAILIDMTLAVRIG